MRQRVQKFLAIAFFVALAVSGFLLASCSTLQRSVIAPPEIEGATFVGTKSCYECHTNYVRSFPGSPHARVHFQPVKAAGDAGCEVCHGPGSKHVEVGGGRGRFIINPGRDPSACYACHLQTHAEFNLPNHHPIPEGHMNCVQCHDPHGFDIMKPARGLAMARLNESCAECHREQTKPHVFEHEALRDGCMTCHQPHGSVNPKMLVERDNNLCLKCHAQTHSAAGEIYIGKEPHGAHLALGGCWSAGCHTAVHGSNINPHLRY